MNTEQAWFKSEIVKFIGSRDHRPTAIDMADFTGLTTCAAEKHLLALSRQGQVNRDPQEYGGRVTPIIPSCVDISHYGCVS